ncbi:MAG: stage II sporulation protein P [Dethiobacteria bacterium]|jgi:stage II sporulation protein P
MSFKTFKKSRYHTFKIHKKRRNGEKKFLIIPLILFLFLLAGLVIPPLARSAGCFISQTWLSIKAEQNYPFTFLLRWTLPGMGKSNKAINMEPLPDYRSLLLSSQLVGFPARYSVPQKNDTGEASLTGDAEETGNAENMEKGGPPPREVVSYLGEAEPQNPKERPLQLKEGGPLVLIYHTHATESFVPDSGSAFTKDTSRTVVALGSLLARTLENKHGIPVLHHKGVFDIPRSYAYEKARPEIERLLKENPQIKVVLDLHRDGVSRRVTTTTLNGLQTGRLLFVLGTRHQGWQNNLRFYYYLQGFLEEKYPGLSRGVLKNNFVYNQHLHERSLIVEIGGHENSLEEARRSIPLLAEAVAHVFE